LRELAGSLEPPGFSRGESSGFFLAYSCMFLDSLVERPIREDEVDVFEYLDYHKAYHQVGRCLDDVYMH
jgi:hypothetical protein